MGKKGAEYERTVRDYFRGLGRSAERNLEQSRDGGIDVSVDLPLAVECKDRKRVDLWATIAQVKAAASPGKHPVAFLRKKNGRGRPAEEVVALPVEDFMEMVNGLIASGWWK